MLHCQSLEVSNGVTSNIWGPIGPYEQLLHSFCLIPLSISKYIHYFWIWFLVQGSLKFLMKLRMTWTGSFCLYLLSSRVVGVHIWFLWW